MSRKGIQLLVVFLVLIAIPLTVLAIQMGFELQTSADAGTEPIELVVSNISDSSATICWYTANPHTGIINWGTTADSLTSISNDKRDDATDIGEYNNHCVQITNLTADTQYFYKITSGADTYTTYNNEELKFKTVPSSDDLGTPESILGTISPAIEVGVVYAHASDGTSISTPISLLVTNSNFVIATTNFRDATSGDIFDLTGSDILISVTDKDGNRGNSQISSDTSETVSVSIGEGGITYNPSTVFQPGTGSTNPTTTTTVDPTAEPSTSPTVNPGTPIVLGSVNTNAIISDIVSYGGENTNPTVPSNIFMSNISPTSFCVNWITKEPALGTLLYTRNGDPEKLAIDGRDSVSLQSKRFTHRVCITESDFSQDEKVGFYIVSNNLRYGINSLGTSSSRYVFAMPPITDSPPAPGTVDGSITKSFSSISKNPQDTVVYGRYEGSANSTWISNYPNSTGANWDLQYTSALDTSLSDFFTGDLTDFKIKANGEYNSSSQSNVANEDDTISLNMDSGVSVTSVSHLGRLNNGDTLSGTASPSSNVTVNLGTTKYSTQSNSAGSWSVNLNPLSSGTTTLNTVDDSGKSLTMSVVTYGTSSPQLPSTSIEDYRSIIIAIVLLSLGFVLKREISRRKLENF